jgi:hypothetical protein
MLAALPRVAACLALASGLTLVSGTVQPLPARAATALAHLGFEGNVLDDSGNGNNGVVQGTVGYVAGHTGQAIDLSAGGYVELPPNLIMNNQDFTVEMWFKTTASGGLFGYQDTVVSAPLGSNATWFFVPILSVRSDTGQLFADMWTGSHINLSSPNAVNDGQWHHVQMTSRNSAPAGISLVLDGLYLGSVAGVPNHDTMIYNQVGRNAGWDQPGHTTYWEWNKFSGQIDDFTFMPRDSTGIVTDRDSVLAGGVVNVSTWEFPAGNTVTVFLDGDVTPLGTDQSDALGWALVPMTVPAGTAPGAHTITATGQGINGVVTLTYPLTVLAPNATPPPTSTSTSGDPVEGSAAPGWLALLAFVAVMFASVAYCVRRAYVRAR